MSFIREVENEQDPNATPVRIAESITTGSEKNGDLKTFMLKDLLSDHLRIVAKKLGCVRMKLGSSAKFVIQKAIAQKHDYGTAYDRFDIPNPIVGDMQLKVNTMFRIVNVTFLPEFLDRIKKQNDAKRRQDYEKTACAKTQNPNAELWSEISAFVNDPEQNDRIGLICMPDEDQYGHLQDIVDSNQVQPSVFSHGSNKTCATHMREMWKARNRILLSKTTSGAHQPDTFGYLNKKHLEIRKGYQVPGLPVYYLDFMCSKHPEMDAAYAEFLKENLKSSSDKDPVDGTDTKRKPKDDFLDIMKETSEQMESAQSRDDAFKKEMLQMQKEQCDRDRERIERERQAMETRLWNEYSSVYASLEKIQYSDNPNERMINNIALRIQKIEQQLAIDPENSIVSDILNK